TKWQVLPALEHIIVRGQAIPLDARQADYLRQRIPSPQACPHLHRSG
ncbi:MAG: hypothetical protein ACI9W2_004793, partial [Gammaproteobacteria bacterium]